MIFGFLDTLQINISSSLSVSVALQDRCIAHIQILKCNSTILPFQLVLVFPEPSVVF